MRLIDADALYSETEKKIKANHEFRMAVVDDEFLDLIKDADTVDAVEVVRCKDCKYCTKEITWNGEEYLNCEMAAELADNGVEIDGNQFCSYGERREG